MQHSKGHFALLIKQTLPSGANSSEGSAVSTSKKEQCFYMHICGGIEHVDERARSITLI